VSDRLSTPDSKELQRVRAICLSNASAIEKMSHGAPTWFTKPKGKWFGVFDERHHSPHISLWLPTPVEIQRGLVASDPARFWIPPYVGKKGWTAIILENKPDWKIVESFVKQAFLFAGGTNEK
jgi:predicted DNA-binding protein (MmcQ/YjbR family)